MIYVRVALLILASSGLAWSSDLTEAVLDSNDVVDIPAKLKGSRWYIKTAEDVPDKLLDVILNGQVTDEEWKALQHYSQIDDAGASLEFMRSCFRALQKDPTVFYTRFMEGDQTALERMADALGYDFSAYEPPTKSGYEAYRRFYEDVLTKIAANKSKLVGGNASKRHDRFMEISRRQFAKWKARYQEQISNSFSILARKPAVSSLPVVTRYLTLSKMSRVWSSQFRNDGFKTDNSFERKAAVTAGDNAVTVMVTDVNGNTTTNHYNVTVTGGGNKTLVYDANGNLPTDGTRTFEWDALNRLTAVTSGTHRSEFTYNGLNQRVKIVEKDNGAVTSTKQFVWIPGDPQPSEERDGSNTVTKRYYLQGVQIGTTNYYYTRDHLGSVCELTDSSGIVQSRYDYDPYGRRAKLSGNVDADFGFTGHCYHQPSELNLALYRGYDADLGRWISRDPIGETGLYFKDIS